MPTLFLRWFALGAAIALSGCSGSKLPEFESNHQSTKHAADMAMPSTGDPDADFLAGMIPHHEGAVAMARKELAMGTDPKVRAMAKEVIATQQAEIERMQQWLAERPVTKKGDR